MATCITPTWGDSTSPQVKLTVTLNTSLSTGDEATLDWKLEYIASYAVSGSNIGKAYTVKIAGTTVKNSTFVIAGKKGTYTIASGTHTVNKTIEEQTISFSTSFTFNVTWSGVYGSTKSASSTIDIAAKNKYTVSYNANGGTGAPSSQSKWHGVDIALSKTKPTRTNYTFKGWGTSSTATTESYEPGDTYSADKNITLYAIWETTYTKPRITSVRAYRSNSPNTDIIVKFNWATDKTVSAIKVYYTKGSSTTQYNVAVTPSGTTSATDQTVIISDCDIESSYTVWINVYDGTSTTTSIKKSIGTTVYTIDGYVGGNGVAFGKVAEMAGYLDSDFNNYFRKEVQIHGKTYLYNNTSLTKAFYMLGTNTTSVINSTNKLIFALSDYTVKQAIMSGNTGLWISDNTGSVTNGCGMDFSYLMWKPLTNDKLYLGGANFKWKAVYAVSGAIQTSDRNKKEDIKPMSDKYEMLFSKLKPVTYKLKNSEGETHDRVHTGFISQDIEESLEECGLTDLEFAAFCKDIKQTTKEGSDEVVDILDEDGNPTYEYSLRYEEFIALNTHIIQKQQRRINDLENEVSELKDMVKALMKEV